MSKINKLNKLVGKALMNCQLIEHDIKVMYACSIEGDIDKNLESIKNMTLGEALIKFKEVDQADGKLYLDEQTYKELNQIRNLRNQLAHTIYADFIYLKGSSYRKQLKTSIDQIKANLSNLKILSKKIEKARVKLAKKHKYDKRRSKKVSI